MCLANATMCLAMNLPPLSIDDVPSNTEVQSYPPIPGATPRTPEATTPRPRPSGMTFNYSNTTQMSLGDGDAGEDFDIPSTLEHIGSADVLKLAGRRDSVSAPPPMPKRDQFDSDTRFRAAMSRWQINPLVIFYNHKQEAICNAYNEAKTREDTIKQLTFLEDDPARRKSKKRELRERRLRERRQRRKSKKRVPNGVSKDQTIRRRLLTTQRLLNAEEAHATL
jgi:hypothetical protein